MARSSTTPVSRAGFLLVLTLLLLSQPSHADWEFTKWGMSPEEVLAASNGTATRMAAEDKGPKYIGPPASGTPLLKGMHKTWNFDFSVTYFFVDEKLYGVRLKPELALESVPLQWELRSHYGEPNFEKNYGEACRYIQREWLDRSAGNGIQFIDANCGSDLHNVSLYFLPLDATGTKILGARGSLFFDRDGQK